MKIVLIREGPNAPPNPLYLKDKTGEEVTQNAIPEEGIAIIDCKNLETFKEQIAAWQPDRVIRVGECILGRFRVSDTIPRDSSEGKLIDMITAIAATDETQEPGGD